MHEDTIRLLGDCTAGIDRTICAIDGLLPGIRDYTLRQTLRKSRADHAQLRERTSLLLRQLGGEAQAPSPVILGMTRLRTGVRMTLRRDDATAAWLVAEGCESGAKALCRSRNCYVGADPEAQSLVGELIQCEDQLSDGLRTYL